MPEQGKGNWKKINGTLQHRICEMAKNGVGHLKHEAQEKKRSEYIKEHGNTKGYNNAGSNNALHSIETIEDYRKEAERYSKWLADHGVKYEKQATREMAVKYLRERNEIYKHSAWSVGLSMSAINKLWPEYKLTGEECHTPKRKQKDVVRSRKPTKSDREINYERHKDVIAFAKGTGLRRSELESIRPCDCIRNDEGKVVAIHVRSGKGGRSRTSPILNEYKDRITEILDSRTEYTKPVFPKVIKRLDIHSYRADYANDMLAQIEKEARENLPLCGGDFNTKSLINIKGKDINRPDRIWNHEKSHLAFISGCLGHSRIEVLKSYLRF